MKTERIIFEVSGFVIWASNRKTLKTSFANTAEVLHSLFKTKTNKDVKISFKVGSALWTDNDGISSLEIKSTSENEKLAELLADKIIEDIIISSIESDLRAELIDAEISKIYFRVGSTFQHIRTYKISFENKRILDITEVKTEVKEKKA